MANNCFVGIDIITATPEDAERLRDSLAAAKKAADERQEGIFIGCPTRYLFDADTGRIGDTLFISGWVKWGFQDSEVWQFLAWLMKQVTLTDFRMTYDEGGCLLYGEYRYDMKTLTDRYLPQDKFPTGEGDDVDTELAFSKHGVTRIIG